MLKVQNLNKAYDKIHIFEDITFDIPRGAIVSLLGENGIGKTTLLKIIGGLIDFQGSISWNNISLKNDFNMYISNIAYIPNTPFLYDYLTANEMIDLMIDLTPKERQKEQFIYKQELVRKLNLEKYKDILIKNLSLGTKQKISYMISFINSPSLILIDEPFVNFDNTSLEIILDFIRNFIKANNSTIIFATHSEDPRISSIITHKVFIESSKIVNAPKEK